MVNFKLLGEKRSDACENIHISQATKKRQYDRKQHLRSICHRAIDSIFYNVYVEGRYDRVFGKINPKELKCFFRKWPIIKL